MKKLMTLLAALFLFQTAPAMAATYDVDPDHSTIGFSVRHMVISNVKGDFTDYAGSFVLDEKKKVLKDAQAVIGVASIDTGKEKRDKHLRSDEFFDAANHPKIMFKFHRMLDHDSDGEMEIEGDLTIRGVTKRIKLEGQFYGTATDPWGNQRAGFTAKGKINRKDFGVNYSKTMDNGGLVVGDDVTIELEIEGIARK